MSQDYEYCRDKNLCSDGNCPGCKNKKKWCEDPRCTPNCPSCPMIISFEVFSNLFFALITTIIFLGLAILLLFKGKVLLEKIGVKY
jgi:hypothetical protein